MAIFESNKDLIIFGGTFDPPHKAHQLLVQAVSQLFPDAEIRIMPVKQPVHKGSPMSAAEHRLQMCRLAFESNSAVVVDDFEIRANQQNYTFDTLRELKAQMGERRIAWLIGGDSLLSFKTWKNSEQILSMAHLIVIPRQNYTWKKEQIWWQKKSCLAKDLFDQEAGKICVLDFVPPAWASSDIRKNIATMQPALDAKVWRYIIEHHLYGR